MKQLRTVLLLIGVGMLWQGVACGRAAEPLLLSLSTNGLEQVWPLETPRPSIWSGEVGAGFRSGVEHVSVVAGAGFGMAILGSSMTHDLALTGLSYGQTWGGVKGEGNFWRGNWEWRLEAFGGAQYHPDARYVLGLTPHLRYNFATGTRWVPFADVGLGVTGTDIGAPDLGGCFQFNIQGGAGLDYFLRDNLALSAEYRFLHLSSARINTPNLGVNSCLFLLGINWFF